jgi:hypothetical protein
MVSHTRELQRQALLIHSSSSGDTGVSASIVLHGAPPFQVFYRTQRDQEQPREQVKTIYGSRGDLKLQPEHSGHYVYTFVSLSDANYKKIPLGGPSIEQSVHPLASVDFSHKEQGGRQKQINSCSGSTVDIDIELKVRSVTIVVTFADIVLGCRTVECRSSSRRCCCIANYSLQWHCQLEENFDNSTSEANRQRRRPLHSRLRSV